jgi:predicted nucleotidyltransferase
VNTNVSDFLQNDPALKAVVDRLVEVFGPETVYLFGSKARGDDSINSDYDLLVIVRERFETRLKLAQKAHKAVGNVKTIPCDILVYSRDEFERYKGIIGSLPETIVREGKTLYAA